MVWIVPQALSFVVEPRVFYFNISLSNVSFGFIRFFVASLVRLLNCNHVSLCGVQKSTWCSAAVLKVQFKDFLLISIRRLLKNWSNRRCSTSFDLVQLSVDGLEFF